MSQDDSHAGTTHATARPVVVVGAAGQLGCVVADACGDVWPTVRLTRRDLDLSVSHDVRTRLAELRPWAIVNCAGYNEVDKAEDEARAALSANAFAVLALARAARELDAVFVHYSSDFVFDGRAAGRPYEETDRPAPQSVYAASKLLGEWFAAEATVHYVLRVESLFGGPRAKSSLDRIVASIAAGRHVRVFMDRVVTPSYVCDIAAATVAIVRSRPPSGIYHCVNSGEATWHELALEARRLLGTDSTLEPVSTKDVVLRAARPQYCALSNEKLRAAGITMPAWQDALARAIATAHRMEGGTSVPPKDTAGSAAGN